MYQLVDLLAPERVRCQVDASSRKRVLQLIAEVLADEELGDETLFDGLMNRERLGGTGLGDGVAIPHCRLPCKHLHVAFFTLAHGIDYEAVDGKPVDLLFVLVVPEGDNESHLEALAQLAEIFGNATNRDRLRACDSDDLLLTTMKELLDE